jgi:hypothetical protein
MHPAEPRRSSHASRQSAPLGQMTAVMRAMTPRSEAPKALRVGLVRDGRVVEERLVKAGAVTIGEAEDASLVVPGVARTHRLFTEKNGRFTLHPLPGLCGRVAVEDTIRDVAALGAAIALDVRARGRLTIGDATLLFQLVEAPIAAARPMLPLAVKTSLLDVVDWPLTILVAMSFLLHFGIVGAMYSDWTDRVVDESFTVQGLVDVSRPLPPPIVEDPEHTTPTTVPVTTATPAPTSTAPSTTPRHGTTDSRPTRDPNAGLVEAAERMRLDLLATTAPGSALADALARSNIPPVTLDHADGAVTTGSSDLTLHTASPIDPSARHGDLSTIGVTRKDGSDHVVVHDTPGPQYSIDARTIPGTSRIPSAERTVLSLRPAFRRCYELGLQKDPTMSGDVTIRARLRATGEVDSAQIVAQNGLSAEVTSCIQRKVATAEFERPEGGSATLDIPVKFVRQR